jgi:hypothetical protein
MSLHRKAFLAWLADEDGALLLRGGAYDADASYITSLTGGV